MEIDPVYLVLVVSRWVHFAALDVVFGSASFWSACAPGEPMDRAIATPVAALRVAALVAAISGVSWLAGTIAFATGGLGSLVDPAVLRVFFLDTPFGVPVVVRFALLSALVPIALMPMTRGLRLASSAVVAATLLVSQAWLGHADEGGDTAYGVAMIATYAVHVVSTAWWAGGLPTLIVVVARAKRDRTGVALYGRLRRYSTVATIVVALIVVSGSLNTIYHDGGSLADLRSTSYGWVLLVKVTLVAVMLAFAAINRFVLMPRLVEAASAEAVLGRLRLSVILDTCLAVLVLGAAAVLGITPPPR